MWLWINTHAQESLRQLWVTIIPPNFLCFWLWPFLRKMAGVTWFPNDVTLLRWVWVEHGSRTPYKKQKQCLNINNINTQNGCLLALKRISKILKALDIFRFVILAMRYHPEINPSLKRHPSWPRHSLRHMKPGRVSHTGSQAGVQQTQSNRNKAIQFMKMKEERGDRTQGRNCQKDPKGRKGRKEGRKQGRKQS